MHYVLLKAPDEAGELVRSHRCMHTFGVMAVERIRVSWLLFEISKMVIIYAMDRSAYFTKRRAHHMESGAVWMAMSYLERSSLHHTVFLTQCLCSSEARRSLISR